MSIILLWFYPCLSQLDHLFVDVFYLLLSDGPCQYHIRYTSLSSAIINFNNFIINIKIMIVLLFENKFFSQFWFLFNHFYLWKLAPVHCRRELSCDLCTNYLHLESFVWLYNRPKYLPEPFIIFLSIHGINLFDVCCVFFFIISTVSAGFEVTRLGKAWVYGLFWRV